MTIEVLLTRLRRRRCGDDQAMALAHCAFVEWLAALPADSAFGEAAQAAYVKTLPWCGVIPSAAPLCAVLAEAIERSPMPVTLCLPVPARRGGAKSRRLSG